jgi:hypothetical protein
LRTDGEGGGERIYVKIRWMMYKCGHADPAYNLCSQQIASSRQQARKCDLFELSDARQSPLDSGVIAAMLAQPILPVLRRLLLDRHGQVRVLLLHDAVTTAGVDANSLQEAAFRGVQVGHLRDIRVIKLRRCLAIASTHKGRAERGGLSIGHVYTGRVEGNMGVKREDK